MEEKFYGFMDTFKTCKVLTLLLLIVGINSLHTQTTSCFDYKIRVDEVNFLSPNNFPNHKINMVRDYDPHPPIVGLAWKYPNAETPVAFVSGKAPRVYAKFELAGCTKEVWAKGDGPGDFDPVVKKLIQGIYPATPLPVPFPSDKVDFYEPFEITWYISNSSSGPWIEAGKSTNPLYVIYGNTPLSTSTPIFHSLIYYGCKNAKGLTAPNLIVENIYTGTFSSRTLPRKDTPTKPAMSYWIWPDPPGQSSQQCFETEELLRWENGRCGAWANFFNDMIEVQGISGAEIAEVIWEPGLTVLTVEYDADLNLFFGTSASNVTTDQTFEAEFFVKDFSLSSNKFYKWDREWNPYGTTTTPVDIPNGNVLNYAPAIGVPAQGNVDPMSVFFGHNIVKYNAKYFDPSYGTPIQNSKNDWENMSLIGFGNGAAQIYTYVLSGMTFETRIMWLYKNNTPLLQTIIDP